MDPDYNSPLSYCSGYCNLSINLKHLKIMFIIPDKLISLRRVPARRDGFLIVIFNQDICKMTRQINNLSVYRNVSENMISWLEWNYFVFQESARNPPDLIKSSGQFKSHSFLLFQLFGDSNVSPNIKNAQQRFSHENVQRSPKMSGEGQNVQWSSKTFRILCFKPSCVSFIPLIVIVRTFFPAKFHDRQC